MDSYGDSIGNFYENYGHSGAKAELVESLSKGIDQRVAQYEDCKISCRITFQTYKDKYIDLLEQMLKEKAKHFNTPMKTSINRQEVSAVYEYTMSQYRQSGDILDAFTKGAKHARSIFEENFSDKAESPGSYSAKYDWDNFFDQSQYTGMAKGDTIEEKYRKSISRFVQGLESDDNKKFRLLFGSSGDYEFNLFV